ncbi:MAG: transposase [Deltaproteobacteria bacterium]|nr:transposase [Deltaproteobacteria bacterium]
MLYHVMARGIEKRDIFLDNKDRNIFLKRFSIVGTECGIDCLAWSLMPNHIHLLIRPTASKLATFMQRLLTSYAVTFNLRHDRVGHLFQNRYKSIICQEESYLLQLVRYIHLNPVKLGLVEDIEMLDRYPWTGHSVLAGTRTFPVQRAEEVLEYFGRSVFLARRRYREFLVHEIKRLRSGAEGINNAETETYDYPPEWELREGRILGSEAFAQTIKGKNSTLPDNTDSESASMDELLIRVCRQFRIRKDDLMSSRRDRRLSDARAVICFLATRELGYSGAEVSGLLEISQAAVSLASKRGQAIVETRQSDSAAMSVQTT